MPFCRKMYVAAHFHTDVFAKKCHHKRHESYPNQGIINLLELQQAHARERKANAEGINACGHGEHQQNLEARRVYAEVGIVMLLAVTIAHHLETQETEKGAGNPSVGGSNTAQHIAKQPTEERHQCLEEAEKESHRPNLSTHTPILTEKQSMARAKPSRKYSMVSWRNMVDGLVLANIIGEDSWL